MRSRGSYRFTNRQNILFDNKKVKVIEVSDTEEEVIDITEGKDSKFCCQTPNVKRVEELITIESDDDFEVELIESTSSSSVLPLFEKKAIPFLEMNGLKNMKKCVNCLGFVTKNYNSFKYNQLTSADFYLNPRIHPSVIPLELRDKNRFNCFQESITQNQSLFVDRNVLVIGSATGLLALLVAKARAQNVIIIDRDGIIEIIESVIEKNRRRIPKKTNFYIIKHSIEESNLPNGLKKVDIIVSDWANNSLFYKSMIDTFINARNKWLRKGGLIFPDSVNIYLSGAHDNIHKHKSKDKRNSKSLYVKRIDYWDKNLYGFNMSAVRHKVLSEPFHEYLKKSQVITNEFLIKSFNLYEITLEDMSFSLPFELTAAENHYLQSFALFFDIIFSKNQTIPLMFSTRPKALKHMFRPTILFIENEKQLTLIKDDKIKGVFTYNITPNLTQLSIEIEFNSTNRYFDVNHKLFYTLH